MISTNRKLRQGAGRRSQRDALALISAGLKPIVPLMNCSRTGRRISRSRRRPAGVAMVSRWRLREPPARRVAGATHAQPFSPQRAAPLDPRGEGGKRRSLTRCTADWHAAMRPAARVDLAWAGPGAGEEADPMLATPIPDEAALPAEVAQRLRSLPRINIIGCSAMSRLP
jgi:hypothetical protein